MGAEREETSQNKTGVYNNENDLCNTSFDVTYTITPEQHENKDICFINLIAHSFFGNPVL